MSQLAHAGLFDATRFDHLIKDHSTARQTFRRALDKGKTVLAEYYLEGSNAATLGADKTG